MPHALSSGYVCYLHPDVLLIEGVRATIRHYLRMDRGDKTEGTAVYYYRTRLE